MNELLQWLLFMPSAQRNAIIKTAKRMARTSGASVSDTLMFVFEHRNQLHTRVVR